MTAHIKEYFSSLQQELASIDERQIENVIALLFKAWKEERQIFILGNGGSAAEASHFACDLSKGTLSRHYDEKERRFRVLSLTDNVALMTAFANDLSFEDVFAQQLNNLVKEGDLIIAISGSGNSPNVLKAVELGKRAKAITIGIIGFNGGKLLPLVDYRIHVNSNHYGRMEDIFLILHHIITNRLADLIKAENKADESHVELMTRTRPKTNNE